MSERKLLFLMNAEQALAFARLVEAAERGDGAAACELGDRYRVGAGGLRYSPQQTFRWYSRSALAGDANGQCNLGACYEHGLGCAQSYVKAVKWYRLSAAQWLGTASMNLGYCHLRGHGVPVGQDGGAAAVPAGGRAGRGEGAAGGRAARARREEEQNPVGRCDRGGDALRDRGRGSGGAAGAALGRRRHPPRVARGAEGRGDWCDSGVWWQR